jgi:dipeptidyl aminopeptidase/acylaminoacyl peptidase
MAEHLRSEPIAPTPRRGVPAVRAAWRWALAVALLLVLGYGALSAVVAERLTRPARTPLVGTPADVQLAYEPVQFASVGEALTLRGWWMPAARADRAVIIVHGRESNRTGSRASPGQPGSLLRQARWLVAAGYGVLAFDLRAHGESDGVRYSLGPWERRDLLAAIALVRDRGVAPGRIGLLCHSMGAATCLLTAPEAPEVGAVVSDSTYARLDDLLEAELPKGSGLPPVFNPGILALGKILYGVDVAAASPEDFVARIGPRPVLFFHSEDDPLIPVEHARRLWRASGQGPAWLWLVRAPGHDRVFEAFPEEYERRVLTVFDEAMP